MTKSNLEITILKYRQYLHFTLYTINNFDFTIFLVLQGPGRHIDDEQQPGSNNVTTNSTMEVSKNVQLVGVRLPLRSRSDI